MEGHAGSLLNFLQCFGEVDGQVIGHHGRTDDDVAQILASCPADFIGGLIATKPPVGKQFEK